MSKGKNIFQNRTFLVAISFLLVMVLAAVIFGAEYSSAVSESEQKINSQNSQIKALESERDNLASKNAENESKIAKHQQELDDLDSVIKALESEIEHIKLTKAQMNSSKNSNSAGKNQDDNTPIDMSNLTAPNKGYKVCYLTFDDGPSDNTLKILDILKKANAKASFFVIGTSKLDYIKRIHAEGHTVALHANQHEYSKIYKNETNYFNDLNAISNKVKNLIGIEPKIIRFPGGSSNAVSKKYNKGIMTRLTKQVQQKGYTYVDWNVDSTDASGNNVSKDKILKNIKTYSKGRGDICVLMHDTAAKNTTVEALPEIIAYLRGQGYRFEALTTESTVFHHGVNN
ncbi:MAG: polysaccharide deacetylase [Ruminococcaceae bacterium]|nr:polysaccharide deacetylase [Oscillospiraceae bacterium]